MNDKLMDSIFTSSKRVGYYSSWIETVLENGGRIRQRDLDRLIRFIEENRMVGDGEHIDILKSLRHKAKKG